MKRVYRRLWHLVGGSFFPVLSIFVSKKILLLTLGSFSAVVFAVELVRLFYPRFNNWIYGCLRPALKEEEKFKLTGTTYLLVAALFVFAFFEKEIAAISLLFLSVGDLVAVVIGEKYGRIRVFNKSVEGSIACFISCSAIGLIFYIFKFADSIVVIFAGATAATLIELFPVPVNDNLTIPVASAVMMFLTEKLLNCVL
jgi:glycerol-3-phosphate acyltransferase PlsY